jgi:hypothetical protein
LTRVLFLVKNVFSKKKVIEKKEKRKKEYINNNKRTVHEKRRHNQSIFETIAIPSLSSFSFMILTKMQSQFIVAIESSTLVFPNEFARYSKFY